jgi:hypothetical protein
MLRFEGHGGLKDSREAGGRKGKSMQDVINMLMLVCASLAAMAFGVLAAYGICRAAFALLRVHARSVAMEPQAKPQVARLT